MRFPYQAYPVTGIGAAHVAVVYRPTKPIRAIGPTGDALAYGLVDTGADDTMLPDRFIGPLGVVIRPGDHAIIVALDGGFVAVRYGTVDLELRRRGVVYRWSARVAFHPVARAILGQAGFLEHLTSTFNGRRRHVTLTPKGTAPAPSMPTS
jgi:hypothetical protein